MGSFELARLGSKKSPLATTTATSDVESGVLMSRQQRNAEARESTKNADEAVLAKFGKKQQLTVSINLQSATS